MSTTKSSPKITIWVWSSGLYPRRVLYYFRAKGLTPTHLKQHNIHLIPVTLSQTEGLVSFPGYEARPTTTSLPVLRVQHPDGKELWMRESMSILEYLEDMLPASEGYKSLRGETIEQAARTRDLLGLTNDAAAQFTQCLINSDKNTLFWSGMKEDEMHADTAAFAAKKWTSLLEKLSSWVEEDIIEKGTRSLSGAGSDVTLADTVLMANVDYLRWTYGVEFVGNSKVLQTWYGRMKGASWVLDSDQLGGHAAREDLDAILLE